MKAYQIGAQNGLEALTLVERPDPAVGPGQVLVGVRSACLNHRDLNVMIRAYGPPKPPERIPLSEGLGEVLLLGEGVKDVAVGDRVIAGHFATWLGGAFTPAVFSYDLGISVDGWLAEKMVAPAAALVKIPDEVSDDQAAALSAAGLTAWNALVEVAKIKAGDLVLALGTGGVSTFALQIAKMHGAQVAITSSSDVKLSHAGALGADFTVNYARRPDWAAAFLEATGGRGADVVVEMGGQATLDQSLAACGPNGRIVLIGALGGAPAQGLSNFQAIIRNNLTIRGITAGNRQMLMDLVAAVRANGLVPIIDKVFDFEQAPDAYRYLKSGGHLGKVMIRVAKEHPARIQA